MCGTKTMKKQKNSRPEEIGEHLHSGITNGRGEKGVVTGVKKFSHKHKFMFISVFSGFGSVCPSAFYLHSVGIQFNLISGHRGQMYVPPGPMQIQFNETTPIFLFYQIVHLPVVGFNLCSPCYTKRYLPHLIQYFLSSRFACKQNYANKSILLIFIFCKRKTFRILQRCAIRGGALIQFKI